MAERRAIYHRRNHAVYQRGSEKGTGSEEGTSIAANTPDQRLRKQIQSVPVSVPSPFRLPEGKATISREVAEILQRIGSSADRWQARLEQLKRRGSRLLGRFFGVTRERLRAVAKKFGVRHLANLGGCPAG